MRHTDSSNESSRAMKESSNTMIYKSVFNNTKRKLKTILVTGAFISLSACSSHTIHSSEPGLAVSSYPVIQF